LCCPAIDVGVFTRRSWTPAVEWLVQQAAHPVTKEGKHPSRQATSLSVQSLGDRFSASISELAEVIG
jgi:hypothetical protein